MSDDGWWGTCFGEVFGDWDEAGVFWWCAKYECGGFGEWREYEWEAAEDLKHHHTICDFGAVG